MSTVMRIGIDASSLRRGGGLTHLVELLRVANPETHNFSKIRVWGGQGTLDRLPTFEWLAKEWHPWLDRSIAYRALWKRMVFPRIGPTACDILFVPGGLYAGNFNPRVAMSQNMLPFEWGEMRRYGVSYELIRNWLLRRGQIRDFESADGLIFLTQYAADHIVPYLSRSGRITATIPHGIDPVFLRAPRQQKELNQCSLERPFSLLYVSIVDVYKHQWNVIEAVGRMRRKGVPVELILVGPSYGPALRRMLATAKRVDKDGEFIRYVGEKSKTELVQMYHAADMFVFASSCENLPNIMIEAMAAGLPIVSSDRGPMPEVLGDAGDYFDPESVDSVERAVWQLSQDSARRAELSRRAFIKGKEFSWRRCADETFEFLRLVFEKAGDSVETRRT